MRTILTVTLGAVLVAPALAQKTGSVNRNAPTVKQTVENAGAKFSLDYTSITWATGRTIKAAMDKEQGANLRQYINNMAKSQPLGAFTTSVDVACGSLKLAAGSYKVAFTINEDLQWEINFMQDDEIQKMPLDLMDSGDNSRRLLMCLYAGDEKGAGVYIAFGKKMAILAIQPAEGETKGG
ncbi:MAG: hypothetical protein Fur0037_28000 [Planctomycetota bacterium]